MGTLTKMEIPKSRFACKVIGNGITEKTGSKTSGLQVGVTNGITVITTKARTYKDARSEVDIFEVVIDGSLEILIRDGEIVQVCGGAREFIEKEIAYQEFMESRRGGS